MSDAPAGSEEAYCIGYDGDGDMVEVDAETYDYIDEIATVEDISFEEAIPRAAIRLSMSEALTEVRERIESITSEQQDDDDDEETLQRILEGEQRLAAALAEYNAFPGTDPETVVPEGDTVSPDFIREVQKLLVRFQQIKQNFSEGDTEDAPTVGGAVTDQSD